jgi:hypothetical protein
MIEMNFSSLRETKMSEYAARFLFGGMCTILAGLVARRYGPTVGGLFLAFPAIFPSGASLIENHEKTRKAKVGLDGTARGRAAAAVDSAGVSLGCIGLMVFALILSRELPQHSAYEVIPCAVLAWMSVSIVLWDVHRRRLFRR